MDEHEELLAAEACCLVFGADGAADDRGNGPDDGIAGGMAELVVDSLEMVDVHHQHREGITGVPELSHGGACVLHEDAPVEQFGEDVNLGEILEDREVAVHLCRLLGGAVLRHGARAFG